MHMSACNCSWLALVRSSVSGEVGDSHLDSDGWIEGLFKHEEFKEKERLIITEIWTPWQTNGGEACKNAALLEKTGSIEPVSVVH